MVALGSILRRLTGSPVWRALTGLTLALGMLRVFFAFYPVFLPGPELAPPFSDAWDGTETAEFVPDGDSFSARLAARPEGGGRLELFLPSVEGMDAIRVRARVRAEELVRGPHAYSQGRVLLGFVDRAGTSRWDWPHTAGTVEDTTPWRDLSHRFLVPESAVSARVLLLNHGRSGLFAIRSVSVVPMRLNPRTPLVFAGWGLVWAAGALFSVRRLRLLTRPGGRALLLAAMAIVTGMLLPERALSAVSVRARRLVERLERSATVAAPATAPSSENPTPTAPTKPTAPRDDRADSERTFDLHKAGHFVAFAWLALAAAYGFGFRRPGGAVRIDGLASLVLFAAAAEQLQWLTLSRNARFVDVTINLLGLAAGLLLAGLLRRWSAAK